LKKKLLKLLLVALVLGLAILYVTNASQPGRRLEGCPDGCSSAPARREGLLQLVSLNILHGFPNFKDLPTRLDLIAQELRRLNADVVLLNEVPWIPLRGTGMKTGSAAASLAGQLGYNYLYYRNSGNKWLIFMRKARPS